MQIHHTKTQAQHKYSATFVFILHVFLALITMVILTACQKADDYHSLSGQTMGTSYHIHAKLPKNTNMDALQQAIDAYLLRINQSMSTYDDNSTIMAFNRMDAGESVEIDDDFIKVLQDSQNIYAKSDGAFDPTVKPLVDLWGFGKKLSVEHLQNAPSDDAILQALDGVGLTHVRLDGKRLSKTKNGIALDFSAIAKGYAVDVIASVLEDFGSDNYMVEIGGEMAILGKNAQQNPWQIAIDAPAEDVGLMLENRPILAILPLSDAHIATSGNYRNSLQLDDIRYSHIINPTTGRPVQNNAASVTVLHNSTALADGWATALSAIDVDSAQKLADAQSLQALFIINNGTDIKPRWQLIASKRFNAKIIQPKSIP